MLFITPRPQRASINLHILCTIKNVTLHRVNGRIPKAIHSHITSSRHRERNSVKGKVENREIKRYIISHENKKKVDTILLCSVDWKLVSPKARREREIGSTAAKHDLQLPPLLAMLHPH
jgi:hypothetical protein